MAELPFGAQAPDDGPKAGEVQSLGTLTNWAGAVISLALIIGIGVWGYQTLSRDVTGVPIVRAATGKPMRVVPDNPGGSPALHQGLAVNRVAADGSVAKPADELILAPEPIELAAEDQPLEDLENSAADSTGPERETRVAMALPESAAQMASIRALADKLSSGAAPLGDTSSDAEAQVEEPVLTEPEAQPEAKIEEAVVVVKGGLKRSLRPHPRPEKLVTVAADAVENAVNAVLEVSPDAVPEGTRLAQLGAFDSPETARKEWDKLNARFDDYMDGKQRVIERAKSGGRVFYRLRAMGFEDLNDARRFCSALVAERADCIPVTTR
jgi:hypothetical protein